MTPPDKPLAALPPIVTSHIFPPIPRRDFDWRAYREGREEGGPYGYGKTEAEAIADLLIMEADGVIDEG